MENIKQLESKIEEWLKPLPHLPANARKWISENLWWITIVGAVLEAWAIWTLIRVTYFVSSYYNAWSDFAKQLGVDTGVTVSAWDNITVIGCAIFMIASIALMIASIKPLKDMKKRGWDIMFLAYLLSMGYAIFNMLNNFSFGAIISVVISAVIGAYFLFEIKSHFVKAGK